VDLGVVSEDKPLSTEVHGYERTKRTKKKLLAFDANVLSNLRALPALGTSVPRNIFVPLLHFTSDAVLTSREEHIVGYERSPCEVRRTNSGYGCHSVSATTSYEYSVCWVL
jgi:hypothetical protein